MTRSRQTADWGSRAGLAKVIPSSVAVGSGTGSADSLGNVTFTTVSSVSFNNVFSSTYDNYKIIINLSTNSNDDADHIFRLRGNSSDLTSSTYAYSSWLKRAVNADISWTGSPATSIKIGEQDTTEKIGQSYCFDLISPFLTQWTKLNANVTMNDKSGNWSGGVVSGLIYNSTSYDGFSLIASAGTFTGTARIYGYTQ